MFLNRVGAVAANSPALRYGLLVGLLWLGFLVAGGFLTLPGPIVPDEFAYLFSAKLFASGRLAAPPPPYPEHFETLYVLTTPTWASRYPPLQSGFLAFGLILGHPLMGVWLSCAGWGAALHWTLRAVVSRYTAGLLLGGWFLFFACGHYWAFSLWGGAAAALCGTLVLGAGLRWLAAPSSGIALLWMLGCVGLSFSRPLEGAVFVAGVWGALFLKASSERRRAWLWLAILTGLVVAVLNMVYNVSVTGDALEFPYVLWESRYQRVPLFVWQQSPDAPHVGPLVVQAVREGILDFRTPMQVFLMAAERLLDDLRRMIGLWVVCPFVLALFLRRPRLTAVMVWSFVGIGALCVLHLVCVPYFPHYGAPFAALFWLVAAWAFDSVLADGSRGIRTVWAAALMSAVLLVYCPRDGRPHSASIGVPDGALMTTLSAYATQSPEPVLIFVEVTDIRPSRAVFCGLYNEPDLDTAHAIYAWDGGAARNDRLIRRFPGRRLVRLRLLDGPAGLSIVPNA